MRLFTAIDLPSHIKGELNTIFSKFSGLRWVNQRQLHLTLRFLGDVPPGNVDEVIAALEKITVPQMTLELDGTGFFPDRHRPAIFWVGISKNPYLYQLKLDMDKALEMCGFPAETRDFKPHITLLRIKKQIPRKTMNSLYEAFLGLSATPFGINCFNLFKSELLASGAKHSVVKTYGADR